MWRELGRQVAMIVLVVAVATGFAMPVAPAGSHHGQTAVSLALGADHPAGCAHDGGCPADQNAPMQGTCFAACAGVTVLPPAVAAFSRAMTGSVLKPSRELALVDRGIPPDPHPPKHA